MQTQHSDCVHIENYDTIHITTLEIRTNTDINVHYVFNESVLLLIRSTLYNCLKFFPFSEDVRRKVESVKAYYRKLKNKRRAGSTSGKTWVFFDRIHGFLGCVTYNTSTVKNSDAGETLSVSCLLHLLCVLPSAFLACLLSFLTTSRTIIISSAHSFPTPCNSFAFTVLLLFF